MLPSISMTLLCKSRFVFETESQRLSALATRESSCAVLSFWASISCPSSFPRLTCSSIKIRSFSQSASRVAFSASKRFNFSLYLSSQSALRVAFSASKDFNFSSYLSMKIFFSNSVAAIYSSDCASFFSASSKASRTVLSCPPSTCNVFSAPRASSLYFSFSSVRSFSSSPVLNLCSSFSDMRFSYAVIFSRAISYCCFNSFNSELYTSF
mmetsp:Transcript_18172/g.24559  ORF Transcript_18172/g.24559 Transcript_18172/m.24559 type:complete len:210 (+) Transcript_18172:1242-1871(+)